MTLIKKQSVFTKDITNKKMKIVREFAAPVEKVWKAWTDSKILDQWWAPKPWKAQTKSMDFRPGGFWLYAMVGPNGEKHWARADYKSIENKKQFVVDDYFSDDNGVKNNSAPSMNWEVKFIENENVTTVEVNITFEKDEDLKATIEMGFQEGFTAAHGNLDELIEEGKI